LNSLEKLILNITGKSDKLKRNIGNHNPEG
jgi:hypothetical protein